jgi:hypothetical protein
MIHVVALIFLIVSKKDDSLLIPEVVDEMLEFEKDVVLGDNIEFDISLLFDNLLKVFIYNKNKYNIFFIIILTIHCLTFII